MGDRWIPGHPDGGPREYLCSSGPNLLYFGVSDVDHDLLVHDRDVVVYRLLVRRRTAFDFLRVLRVVSVRWEHSFDVRFHSVDGKTPPLSLVGGLDPRLHSIPNVLRLRTPPSPDVDRTTLFWVWKIESTCRRENYEC